VGKPNNSKLEKGEEKVINMLLKTNTYQI